MPFLRVAYGTLPSNVIVALKLVKANTLPYFGVTSALIKRAFQYLKSWVNLIKLLGVNLLTLFVGWTREPSLRGKAQYN
jgi:hypothetical protein